MAPRPLIDASVYMVNGFSKFGWAKIGAEHSSSIRFLRAFSWCSSHLYFSAFFRSHRPLTFAAKLGMNFRNHDSKPITDMSSLGFFGEANSLRAFVLSGLISIPSALTLCPRNFICFFRREHFSGLA